MKSPRLFLFSILCATTCLSSGCVTVTTYKKEPRQSVRFSSLKAAQTFYNAYLSQTEPKTSGSLDILILGPYQKVKVEAQSVLFNAAVREADSNHDGLITQAEASAYAAKQGK